MGPNLGLLKRHGEATNAAGRVVRLEEVATHTPGQSVAFIMDTRPCAGAERLAEGVDLLICESTYTSEHQAEATERGHMTAADAARLARHAGAGHLLLTHFSQRTPRNGPYLDDARPIFEAVTAAEDGMVLPIPRKPRAHT